MQFVEFLATWCTLYWDLYGPNHCITCEFFCENLKKSEVKYFFAVSDTQVQLNLNTLRTATPRFRMFRGLGHVPE